MGDVLSRLTNQEHNQIKKNTGMVATFKFEVIKTVGLLSPHHAIRL